ncbi:MAG: SDR family NAD(P)-dependent oxidoreductase [Candidatus Tectomicrobia bacterium]|nr:SDR family NAD(P)-dependent oxidoreductase [Candidatus Tectomicrobia bacterium]
MSLDGKVAIVTGASRGIGKDIALALGKSGAAVVVAARTEQIWDRRLPGTIYSVAEEIQKAGGKALPLKVDVSKEEEVNAMTQKTIDEFGRIDILVNNAAILVPGGIRELQIRHFDLIYRVDLKGPFLCIRACLDQMIKQGQGWIINISSGGALYPGPGPYPEDARAGGAFYGMVKAGLERLSQGIAMELQTYNISVNVLSPAGRIKTPGNLFAQTDPQGEIGPFEDAVEMGTATVWIAQQEPKKFTGNILFDKQMIQEYGIRR